MPATGARTCTPGLVLVAYTGITRRWDEADRKGTSTRCVQGRRRKGLDGDRLTADDPPDIGGRFWC